MISNPCFRLLLTVLRSSIRQTPLDDLPLLYFRNRSHCTTYYTLQCPPPFTNNWASRRTGFPFYGVVAPCFEAQLFLSFTPLHTYCRFRPLHQRFRVLIRSRGSKLDKHRVSDISQAGSDLAAPVYAGLRENYPSRPSPTECYYEHVRTLAVCNHLSLSSIPKLLFSFPPPMQTQPLMLKYADSLQGLFNERTGTLAGWTIDYRRYKGRRNNH